MDKLLAAFERLKSGYKSRSSAILFAFWTWFSNMQKSMLLYVSTLDCCWSGTFAASETMQAMSSKKTESHHALHTVWKRPHRVHDRDHISVNDDRSTMVILMGIAERIDPPSVDFCVWCKPPRRGVTFRPLLFVRNSLCVAFWVFKKCFHIIFRFWWRCVRLRNDQASEIVQHLAFCWVLGSSYYHTRKIGSLFASKTGWVWRWMNSECCYRG